MVRSTLPCILLLLTAGCSPIVKSTALGPAYPARPPGSEVLLFSVRMPECAFEEIGLMTVEKAPDPNFASADAPLVALRERARAMGGDAVIGLTQLPASEGFRGGLRGTVIRFREESCRH